jgi:hypothetical protein
MGVVFTLINVYLVDQREEIATAFAGKRLMEIRFIKFTINFAFLSLPHFWSFLF